VRDGEEALLGRGVAVSVLSLQRPPVGVVFEYCDSNQS